MVIYPTPKTLISGLHSKGMSYARMADALDVSRAAICLLRTGKRSTIVYDAYMKLLHLHKIVEEGTAPLQVKRVSICNLNNRDHEVQVTYVDHTG